jgi:2'-5' RNA ligase
LKFLGEVREKKIEEIKKRLRKIRLESFEAKIDYLGFFDNRKSKFYKNNFILWIHLKNCDKLQKEIDEKLKDLFKKENRFMGHLTIARIKNVENKKEFLRKLKNIKIPELNFNVDSFYLMKSELLEKGPKYFIIEKYKLN